MLLAFYDFPADFLDFLFHTELQVVYPGIQLFDFLLEIS
jgi:hypothetical protein